MVVLNLVAMGFSWWWFLARMFVCWGNDVSSYESRFGCHAAHWMVIALLCMQVVLWSFLILELAALHRSDLLAEGSAEGRPPGVVSAAAVGYRRRIGRHDQVVSGVATILWIIGIVLVIGFVISPFRL